MRYDEEIQKLQDQVKVLNEKVFGSDAPEPVTAEAVASQNALGNGVTVYYAEPTVASPNADLVAAFKSGDATDALTKTSGDEQGAGDWTQHGDGTDYPADKAEPAVIEQIQAMAHSASDGRKFTNLPPMKAHQRGLDAKAAAAKKIDPLQMPGQTDATQQDPAAGGDPGPGAGDPGQADPSQGGQEQALDAGFAEAHAQGLTPEQVAQAYQQYCEQQDGGGQGGGDVDGAEYE